MLRLRGIDWVDDNKSKKKMYTCNDSLIKSFY